MSKEVCLLVFNAEKYQSDFVPSTLTKIRQIDFT